MADGRSELRSRFAEAAGQLVTAELNALDLAKRERLDEELAAGGRLRCVFALEPLVLEIWVVSPDGVMRPVCSTAVQVK
jgi:hypothetical protein